MTPGCAAMAMWLRVPVGVIGVLVVLVALDAALRSFVLPRAASVRLSRWVFRGLRVVFGLVLRPARDYETRDRVMAMFAPIALLGFPLVLLILLLFGFTLIYLAITSLAPSQALRLSGSSLFTLGFAVPDGAPATGVVITEAGIGVVMSALLISYLPTIYGSFSRRETVVTQFSVRAGTPPSPVQLLIRAHQAGFMDRLDVVWNQWEAWFVELEETHASHAVLPFFRSPHSGRNWVNAAGAVLDAAALRMSVLDLPFSPDAGVCIRAGFLSLRAVASAFRIPFDPDPAPDDPIAVSRYEFDEVCAELAAGGVQLRADLDAAWRDFAGWRVNYDAVVLGLAQMVMAPESRWVSDRPPLSGAAPQRGRGKGPALDTRPGTG